MAGWSAADDLAFVSATVRTILVGGADVLERQQKRGPKPSGLVFALKHEGENG